MNWGHVSVKLQNNHRGTQYLILLLLRTHYSALGYRQPSRAVWPMSVLPPKRDINPLIRSPLRRANNTGSSPVGRTNDSNMLVTDVISMSNGVQYMRLDLNPIRQANCDFRHILTVQSVIG